MFEEVLLWGLREERAAREAVERRLRALQLGEAWIGLHEGEAYEAQRHGPHAKQADVQIMEA